MLDDLKKLLGADAEQFATEVQKLSSNGRFDPFALLAGEVGWHSLFLAPFSPSLSEARSRFLADGSGPLAAVVQQFQQGGADATAAAHNARTVFERAQGMCVVVLAGDRGLDTVPQLFFGHLEDAYRQQVVQLCGEKFSQGEALRQALFDGRTVAWFDDTLVGLQRNLEPVVRACLKLEPKGYLPRSSVLDVELVNACPLAFTLRNRGTRTIHNIGDLIRVERYAGTRLQARMNDERETLTFDFEVLNGHVRPREPMRIALSVALPSGMRPEQPAPAVR